MNKQVVGLVSSMIPVDFAPNSRIIHDMSDSSKRTYHILDYSE